jgi:hypothetical protein
LSFQRPDGFFGVLAFGAFAVVVDAAWAGVAKLRDGDDVKRPVQLSVAALVQPVAFVLA